MARTVVKTSEGLTTRIREMRNSGGDSVKGVAWVGGIQPLGIGDLRFRTSVPLVSGVTIVGQGMETLVHWDKTVDDRPLFDLRSYAGNGHANCITIRDMQISCPKGGRILGANHTREGVYYPVLRPKHILLKNLVVRGGMFDLHDGRDGHDGDGIPSDQLSEWYAVTFDNVHIYDTVGQAIRLDGQCHVFRGAHQAGNSSGTKPLWDIRGSAQFEGFSWHEPWGDTLLMRLGSWTARNSYVHRGTFHTTLFWKESHPDVQKFEVARVEQADFHCVTLGLTSERYMSLNDGTLYMQAPPNDGAIKGQGKLIYGGVERVITETDK
jgi:hypothetical protein